MLVDMDQYTIQNNIPLAEYTTLGVGGTAEQLVILDSAQHIESILNDTTPNNLTILGYGANILVSDAGIPGLTVILHSRGAGIHLDEDGTLIADAAVWWDDVVDFAIKKNLWGLELMSYIPGGVGAAVIGNIAAYGQAVKDTLQWVEVLDDKRILKRLDAKDLGLNYRTSSFQSEALQNYIVLRAAFSLSSQPTCELQYQSALKIAQQLDLLPDTLENRRRIIQHTRLNAGSIFLPGKPNQPKTAGSFFKNPVVTAEQAVHVATFDETGRTTKQIEQQNQTHGGSVLRVSAAHVLLAAGFNRGQSWGSVRLHPDHVLKIENTGSATAQEIYDVSQEIISTVYQKLDIRLQPEVQFLGSFTNSKT